VEDRRKQIIEAGLALLREEGLPGLTQPRIATRTGLRQSHLTYYYPTRSDLLTAVARAAMEIQAAYAKEMAAPFTTVEAAANAIATGTVRHDNTRVLMALCQAAGHQPDVRAQFIELTGDFLHEVRALLKKLGLEASQSNADVLHALFVGLSIINLATERTDGQPRSKVALDAVFGLLASQAEGKRPRRKSSVRT
jgi:AcrR family transcriptional regulator